MSKKIKIYGERNTNTIYLSKLIELNLAVNEIPGTGPPVVSKLQKLLPGKEAVREIYFFLTYHKNLGWKHTRVIPWEEMKKYKKTNDDIVFLTITKNPYSWLLSLYQRPYHHHHHSVKEQTFEEFLRTPWKMNPRDNAGRWLKNPIELWNIKNRAYLEFNAQKKLNLTTEAILRDPEAIIEHISYGFSIPKISTEFINYETSTKDRKKTFNYYRNYYLNEKWQDEITREAIGIINTSVDKTLMSYYGYNILPEM